MKSRNTILCWALFLGVVVALIIPQFNFRHERVNAVVEEVRILTLREEKSKTKEGHPVAGAVIGGLIAKTAGAIIGAAVGSGVDGDGMSKTEVSELLGCTVIVCLADQKIVPLRFGVHETGEHFRRLVAASLLRKGDTITVIRRINRKSGKISWYEWRGQ